MSIRTALALIGVFIGFIGFFIPAFGIWVSAVGSLFCLAAALMGEKGISVLASVLGFFGLMISPFFWATISSSAIAGWLLLLITFSPVIAIGYRHFTGKSAADAPTKVEY